MEHAEHATSTATVPEPDTGEVDVEDLAVGPEPEELSDDVDDLIEDVSIDGMCGVY